MDEARADGRGAGATGSGSLTGLCLAMGMVAVGHAMFIPIVPLYALELGATPTLIGAIVSFAFLPSLLLAIPLGGVADRWGPHRLMRLGGGLMTAAPLLLLLWPSLPTLFAFKGLLGLALLMLILSSQAMVATLSAGRRRERDFGVYTTALSVGQALGPTIAGATLDAAGFPPTFAVAMGVASLAWLLGWHLAPKGAPTPGVRIDAEPLRTQLPGLLRNRGVSVAMLTSTAVLFGLVAVHTFLPVRLEALGVSATTIGALFSTKALAAVAVRPFVARISGWFGARSRTLVAVVGAVAVGLALPSVHETIPVYFLMVVFLGLGSGVSQPLSMAMVIDHVEKRQRGVALGLRLSCNRAAQFVAPLVLGTVVTMTGVVTSFLGAAGLLLALAVLIARKARHIDQSAPS